MAGPAGIRVAQAVGVFKLTVETAQDGVTLRLEGRLASAWIEEFASAVTTVAVDGTRVTLDLDGLSFADAAGIRVIREAVDRGVRLRGGSQFIGALISEERR